MKNTQLKPIELEEDQREIVIKAMKLAYYKEFLRENIINQDEFTRLMKIMNRPK